MKILNGKKKIPSEEKLKVTQYVLIPELNINYKRFSYSKTLFILSALTLNDNCVFGAILHRQDKDFNVNDRTGAGWGDMTPLQCAARHATRSAEYVRLLLERGANYNARDHLDVKTPLHDAVAYGRTEAVELMLAAGADLSVLTRRGRNVFHVAGSGPSKSADCVEMLLQRVPELLDQGDREGCTPLHVCLNFGKWRLVKRLIENGASVTKLDEAGRNALHHLAFFHGENIQVGLDLLLEAGASTTDKDSKQGRTPLHLACMVKNRPLVDILVARGLVDLEAVDHQGNTVLCLAVRHSRKGKVVGTFLRMFTEQFIFEQL